MKNIKTIKHNGVIFEIDNTNIAYENGKELQDDRGDDSGRYEGFKLLEEK